MSLFLVYLPSGKKYVDCNIEGMIDKKEFNLRQNKTLLEVKTYSNTILELKEKIEGFLSLLDGIDKDVISEEKLKGLYLGVLDEKDLEMMDGIVKKHIKRVTTTSEWFGKERDRRAVRQNAQLVTVETMYGGVKKYIYVARKYKGHYFWMYKSDGSEVPLLSVGKIERKPLGKIHPRAFKKIKDV